VKITHVLSAALLALLAVHGTNGFVQLTDYAPSNPVIHMRGFHEDTEVHLPSTHLPHAIRGDGAFLSGNWAGYIDLACATCALRYVNTDFTVPSINCADSPNGSYVSEWDGLDGWVTSTVEQAGIDATCNGSTPEYYAWYEMFPLPPVAFTGDINPGDGINVNVYYSASTGHWQLYLDDATAGAYFEATAPCPSGSTCKDSSAEVITEAPSNAGILPLADFGQMAYESTQVTSRNGTHGDLTSNRLWTTSPVTMTDGSGTNEAIPSSVEGGQAFVVTWNAAS
jgi:Peptidase A4 family